MRHQFISEEEFKVIQERVRGANNCNQRDSSLVGVAGVTAVPKAKLSSSSPYKSKLENAWANYLQGLWALKAITSWWYEPLNLRLPGGRNFYKPDFLVLSETGLTFYEVKGRNLSDDRSLVKMKTAAGLTPWAKFILVKRIRGNWEERVIQ